MRLKLLFLYLLLMMSGLGVLPVAADAEVDSCPYTDGAYYRSDVILIYNYRSNIFALHDARSGNLIQIIDTVETEKFYIVKWTPDCHDLVTGTMDKLTLWDVTTLQRKAEIRLVGEKLSAFWDNTRQYIVMHSGTYSYFAYVWHIPDGNIIKLEFKSVSCLPDPWVWHFDYMRHQILGIGKCDGFYESDNGVTVFSMDTGEQLARYESDERWCAIGFQYRLTSAPQYLFVTCDYYGESVAVYNRDIMQHAFILPTRINFDTSYRHDISPDGRFIVGGRRQIRVWKIAQLIADANAAPVLEFDGPRGFVTYLRFLDATTLETKNDFGDTDRWNILTGEQLP